MDRRRLLGPHLPRGIDRPDVATAAVGLAAAAAHLAIAAWASTWSSWGLYLATAWLVGGGLAQTVFLAVHEITHGNALAGGLAPNYWLAIAINALAVPVPFAMTFRKYHAFHHASLAVDGLDTDLPSAVECRVFRGRLGKLAFCALQGVFYTLRPLFVLPMRPTRWELYNWAVGIAATAAIVRLGGWGPVWYQLLSLVLGTGIHPMASHHLSEHYVLPGCPPMATFSRYYPGDWPAWDWLTLGVDRHREHHDMPRVPWRRLPELTAAKPELYPAAPPRTSNPWLDWIHVYAGFILDDAVDLTTRARYRPGGENCGSEGPLKPGG